MDDTGLAILAAFEHLSIVNKEIVICLYLIHLLESICELSLESS